MKRSFVPLGCALIALARGEQQHKRDRQLRDTHNVRKNMCNALSCPNEIGTLPILVEAALAFVAHVLRPHRLEGTQALRRLHVADNTNDDHWWGLQDCDSLDDLLLVELLS